MTLVDLPAPVGAPQLVVTSKEACIVDAHEKDKILVRIRTPKEVGCFSQDVSQTEGPWTVKLVGTTVYCFYYDSELRGNWRAELLPRGRDGKSVIVLNAGFSPNRFTDGQKCLISVLMAFAIVWLVTTGTNMGLQQMVMQNVEERLINLSNRISDLRNHLGIRGQPGEQGPVGPQGQPGPPGPPGICLEHPDSSARPKAPPSKEDIKKEDSGIFNRFRHITIDDLKQNMKTQTLELRHADIPLKTEFPIFKPLSGDCLGIGPLSGVGPRGLQGEPGEEPTADTLEPGTELKPGQDIKLGDYELFLTKSCRIHIIDSKLDVINRYGPTDLNNGQCTLSMQRDGNLVLYHPEKGAVWASRDQFGKHCPLGVTVTKDGELDCQIRRDSPPLPLPKVKEESHHIPLGTTIGAVPYRMGDYQLGLDGCNLMVFGLPTKADRAIVKFPGSDCRLFLHYDGDLVLYHSERGVLWSSIEQGMSPCKNGMTINKEGFLQCVSP